MTVAPALTPGGWVQVNPTKDSPRAMKPSATEQTIGRITQMFTAQGQQFYQVIWNPGDRNPKTGIYHADQLTPLDEQTASKIRQDLSAGTYEPNIPESSTDYQSPML